MHESTRSAPASFQRRWDSRNCRPGNEKDHRGVAGKAHGRAGRHRGCGGITGTDLLVDGGAVAAMRGACRRPSDGYADLANRSRIAVIARSSAASWAASCGSGIELALDAFAVIRLLFAAPVVGAVGVAAAHAGVAAAAGKERIGGDEVTFLDVPAPRSVAADLLDPADDLVTGDDRVAVSEGELPVELRNVTASDAAGLDAQQAIVVTDGRQRQLPKLEGVLTGQHGRQCAARQLTPPVPSSRRMRALLELSVVLPRVASSCQFAFRAPGESAKPLIVRRI